MIETYVIRAKWALAPARVCSEAQAARRARGRPENFQVARSCSLHLFPSTTLLDVVTRISQRLRRRSLRVEGQRALTHYHDVTSKLQQHRQREAHIETQSD